jgi:hypothetical protein
VPQSEPWRRLARSNQPLSRPRCTHRMAVLTQEQADLPTFASAPSPARLAWVMNTEAASPQVRGCWLTGEAPLTPCTFRSNGSP